MDSFEKEMCSTGESNDTGLVPQIVVQKVLSLFKKVSTTVDTLCSKAVDITDVRTDSDSEKPKEEL